MKSSLAVLILFFFSIAGNLFAAPDPLQLLISGKADSAVQELYAHLQTAPKDANAYNLLSRVFFAEGDGDRASEAGEKAVALDGNSSEFHDWLGRAYGLKADHSGTRTAYNLAKKVRAEFERAVALDKHNIRAAKDLLEYYLDAPKFLGGGKDRAAELAEQLIPTDLAVSHWARARVAQKDKDYGSAEKEYQAEIAASKEKAAAWLDLAAFYHEQKQPDRMEEAIQHALHENLAGTSALFDAANLYYKSGTNLSRASDLLHRYLASGEMVEDAPAFQAHYLLGQIDQKNADVKAAANEYRTALAEASQYNDARDALNKLNAAQVASR
jgi:tetratricopeptide (TPR) repeat protein